MHLPRVIAVCGFKRSGKDTVADFIVNNFGYKKIKISEGLKNMIKCTFNMTEEQLETDVKDHVDDRWGVSPRRIMQFMGTEIMQYEIQKIMPEIGRNFWIKTLVDKYIDKYPNDMFVISDLRFIHEYEMLKKYNPCIIRVDRHATVHQCTHVSEKEFTNIPFDIIIKNDSTKQAVTEDVRKFILRYQSNLIVR